MKEKVLYTLSKHKIDLNNKEVLVALSGGADSVALLFVLKEISRSLNLKITAIHVNHNIRAGEALRDQCFCEKLCKEISVPLIVESVDIPHISNISGESLELSARNERYKLFNKHSVDFIATAHNANDNAETVLYNLTRGSGINGICGIPPVRDNIIRPLINCSREEIEEYLRTIHQSFVDDSTNFSDDYTRNKIRHRVIPELRKINPSFIDSVTRLSDNVREDAEFLDKLSKDYLKDYIYTQSEQVLLKSNVNNLPNPIKKRIIRHFCVESGINLKDIDSNRLSIIVAAIDKNKDSVQVFSNNFLKRTKQGFVFYVVNNIDSEFSYSIDFTLPCYRDDKISFIKSENCGKINNLLFKSSVDCDKIVGKLIVRRRINGDKYRPVFRNCNKTLRKLLCESDFLPNEKKDLVVVTDDLGIVYTNLFGIAERVKTSINSKNIIIFNFEGGKI